MEPQENSNVMQSSVPVSLEPKVEPVVPEKPIKKPSKMNGMIIGMVILIVCLVLGLTYYVLKDNGVDLLALGKQTESNTDDTGTTTGEEDDDTAACESTDATSCEVSVDNEGWSLFSVPEYELSVEVPTYTMEQKIGTEDVTSQWKAWFNDYYIGDHLLSEQYLGTLSVYFYPSYIPEGTGCGAGCVKENTIRVDVYDNEAQKSLAAVVEEFTESWNSMYSEDILFDAATLTGKNTTKWNIPVYEYTSQRPGGSTLGFLVVGSKYIYVLSDFFSTSPSESIEIAQKVLDSIKFGN